MLISTTESWKLALDNGLSAGAVFIDFQKAFDTSVSHEILSHKLQAYLAPSTSGLYATSLIDLNLPW